MRASPAMMLNAQQVHEFHLAPFEVLTLDMVPDVSAHN